MASKYIAYLLPVLSLMVCLLFWRLRGRDGTGRGTIIPEYEPPLDLSPAEVGLLHDFKATDREITATLVDLAIRGYINIRRQPQKSFLGSYHAYEFELINDEVLELKDHEKSLLNGLFGVVGQKQKARAHASLTDSEARRKAFSQYPALKVSFIGKKAVLDELKPYFYRYVDDAKAAMHDSLIAKDYFKTNLYLAGFGFSLIGFLCLSVTMIVRGSYFYGLLFSGLVFILFGLIMQSRTTAGKLAQESVNGFLLYLSTAESDRLRMTQAPDTAQYSGDKAGLFEKFLPYAIALGLETEWTKKFNNIYGEPAPWLGTASTDEVVELAKSIHASFNSD